MVKYPANGEASDWMLGNRGIYAMSPELGTSAKSSEDFFIASSQSLKRVVSDNYQWVRYTVLKVLPSITVKTIGNVKQHKSRGSESTTLAVKLSIAKSEVKFTSAHSGSPAVSCHPIVF